MNERTLVLLLFDLYWLRFKKPGDQWYEMTDYLRDSLKKDGVKIKYTEDDILFNYKGKHGSMKNLLNTLENHDS